MWKLNRTVLSEQWIIQEIELEIKKISKDKWKQTTSYQNLCDTAKAIQKGKVIVKREYINKCEKYQINNQ